MKKNILLICFLISFHLSIQITDDELYDYAVIIFRGMAYPEKRENAQCANQLVKRKATVLPRVKNIIKLVNEGASYSDLAVPLLELLFLESFLESDCDLSNLIKTILALKQNNEQLKNTIKQLGQKLSGKIDLSVD